jgi:hypothetical protein
MEFMIRERAMHLEPDTEWWIDAGGVMEISRWCKPPDSNGKYGKPRQGRWDGIARLLPPLPGLALVFALPRRGSGLKSPRRPKFQCPSGTVLPTALKVDDTL